jgi:hypothetical protein
MAAKRLIAASLPGLIALAAGAFAAGRAPQQAAPARDAQAQAPAALQPRLITPRAPDAAAGPAFEYAYLPPEAPLLQATYDRVRKTDLLRQLPEVQAIDGVFALPRRLRLLTAQCGEFGAFYRPAEADIVLCYETLETLYARADARQKEQGLDAGYPQRYTRANVRFIVLHETGHALVQLLDLPVTGRQEDAMDQLAAMLMLHFAAAQETPQQVIANLRMAADQMLARSTGAYDLHAYADEHALGEQRYFNLQCLIYGTDPQRYAGIVAAGDLTEARAQVCPRETRTVGRAWLRLLLPHLAPRYAVGEDEAIGYLERQR